MFFLTITRKLLRFLPIEKRLTLDNVIIRIKSVLNKDKVTTAIIYFQKNARINYLKNNNKTFFCSIIMLRSGETKVTKERFYATKKPIQILDVNVDNIVISKLAKTKTDSKYLI